MDELAKGQVDGRVVAFTEVHIRLKPTTTSPYVAVAAPGDVVRVDRQAAAEMVADTRQGASLFWLHVHTADGRDGWISRLFVDLPYPAVPVVLESVPVGG